MFNSLRSVSGSSTSGMAASASSSGTNTTATQSASAGLGVQHPLLAAGGGLSRRESTESRSGHRVQPDVNGDVPMPSTAPVTLPYKPRQRHSHSASGSGLLASGPVSSTTTTGTLPLGSPGSTNGLSTPPIINEQQPGQGAAMTGLTASHHTYVTAAPFQAGGSHSGGVGSGMARASVTSRLQLQRLKAAAQKAGLVGDGKADGGASLGMKMLEVAVERAQSGRKMRREWAVVVGCLGKATLLLPSSPASSLPLTPQTFKDHIVFATSTGDVLATMSGLVGYLDGDTVRFVSCVPSDHPLLEALRDPATRGATLHALQPLVLQETSTSIPQSAPVKQLRSPLLSGPSATSTPPALYPTYTITHRTLLPFPAPVLPQDPPSPALTANGGETNSTRSRSGSSASLASIGAGIQSVVSGISGDGRPPGEGKPAAGRLFAGLFGAAARERERERERKENEKAEEQARELPELPLEKSSDSDDSRLVDFGLRPEIKVEDESQETPTASRPASLHETSTADGFQIPAWTIDKVVKYSEVNKAIAKATTRRIKHQLDGLPDKAIDKVVTFVSSVHPCYVADGTATLVSPAISNLVTGPSVPEYVLNFRSADETCTTFQHFMGNIYDDLYAHYLAQALTPPSPSVPASSGLAGLRRRGSKGKSIPSVAVDVDATGEEKKEREKKEKLKLHAAEETAENQAVVGADRVEAAVCELFYIRIAALNMLDLSLEHLGVVVKETVAEPGKEAALAERNLRVERGLDRMVDRVGRLLQGLNDTANCTPKTKSDILVQAHKIIIGGLANMPKIRLRPDGEDFESPDSSSSPSTEDRDLPNRPSPNRPADALKTSEDLQETEIDTFEAAATPIPERPIVPPSAKMLPELVLPDAAQQMSLHEAMSNDMTPTGENPDGDFDQTGDDAQHVGSASSGADLLLPLIIYAIVKSNPARLVSHLLFIQRYRTSICATGEANYATVNITAAVEFLENVDLADLGLSSTEKVMRYVIVVRVWVDTDPDTASIASASSKLKGRVQQVGELAGTAAGSARAVVDSSWSALRGLVTPNLGLKPVTSRGSDGSAEGVSAPDRPRLVSRRSSGFSFANVTASVASIANAAQHRERPRSHTWSAGREMTEVNSRPASIREVDEDSDHGDRADSDIDADYEDHQGASSTSVNDIAALLHRKPSDVRSITSVTSMLSGTSTDEPRNERLSISDRFANLSGLGKSPTTPTEQSNMAQGILGTSTPRNPLGRRTTWSTPLELDAATTPRSRESPLESPLLPSAPVDDDAGPPMERFMTCDLSDLRLSEVGELVRDYRRLARLLARQAGSV
ncbi:hypothetical protein QFC22_002964 [Naganishia vaughanmartiniae]|uniref:Uncharacterized protein n=1 Tax=Naganishia vaughanmartiniae TaxID=1424756 RepID=A0ACC2X8V3_9TREE|nr:hypothetical protein QFC22_002964 [Naganishia vaughanmartiniae]